MNIIKRNGAIEEYNINKIINAISKAAKECAVNFSESIIETLGRDVEKEIIKLNKDEISVEEIQDIVENILITNCIDRNDTELAKRYIRFRHQKFLKREAQKRNKEVFELLNGTSDYWNTENSNKNSKIVNVQRDYMAGIVSKDISENFLLPKEIVEAHRNGEIHFHDMDYYAQNALNNCCLINLEDMLQNGTVINGMMIEKPHKFLTAMTIATQIVLGVSSSQYGGCTVTMSHLAPFVRDSYNKYLEEAADEINMLSDISDLTELKRNDMIAKIAKSRLKKEIEAGVQTFNYQVNSMTNTNGQAPFLSVSLYLGETEEYKEELAMIIEEFLKQRILGFKNEKGVYITPAFPKLLYILEEDNIYENSKYYYLTELAAKCAAKRLVPDFISEKKMKEYKISQYGTGDCYGCMGCRSFLTPDRIKGNPAKAKNYVEGKSKYYGRFNMGVVTINLADIALSSKGDFDEFWKIFEKRTELCHKALRLRYERLANITSDVAPILWQNGAFARLNKHESIKPLLHGGYSTISLGYAGLYECVKYMTGESHTSQKGKAFGLQVMSKLNEKTIQWKDAEDIDYSLYGSPIESTTYKLAQKLKDKFGIVEGITDRNYITNSYHIPVFEKIDAFEKLKKESEFQRLSPGGAISYIEVPNMSNNISAMLKIIRFIYDNIMYAEINSKSDYCQNCGFDGEMQIDKNMEWYCPNCGNTDHDKMNVARRTCGYIGTNFWNKGRTEEIKERVLHVDLGEYANE